MKRRHQRIIRRVDQTGQVKVIAVKKTKTDDALFSWFLLTSVAVVVTALLLMTNVAQAQDATPPKTVALDKLMKPGPLPENIKGKADAPVTIVEYSSMTCPHCATFHEKILPTLRSKYIDTGKVRYILREYPLENLAAAASLLARCAGKDKVFDFVDVLYATQEQWAYKAKNPRDKLFELAKQAGFTQKKFDACLKDQTVLSGILEVRRRGKEDYGVQSTPTFFINGQMLEGAQPVEAFEKLMSPFIKIEKKEEKSDERMAK